MTPFVTLMTLAMIVGLGISGDNGGGGGVNEGAVRHLMNSPTDEILEVIEQLQTDIRSQQNDARLAFNKQMGDSRYLLGMIEARRRQSGAAIDETAAAIVRIDDDIDISRQKIAYVQLEIESAISEVTAAQIGVQSKTNELDKRRARRQDVIDRHQESMARLGIVVNMIEKAKFDEAATIVREDMNISSLEPDSPVPILLDASMQLLHTAVNDHRPKQLAALQARLLALFIKIRNGVQNSMDLYTTEDRSDEERFAVQLEKRQRTLKSAQDRVQTLHDSLSDKHNALGQLQRNRQANAQRLVTYRQQYEEIDRDLLMANAATSNFTLAFQAETVQRQIELDAIESARQYIEDHLGDLVPYRSCHVEAPNCPRCLYDAHCPPDQICGTPGVCIDDGAGVNETQIIEPISPGPVTSSTNRSNSSKESHQTNQEHSGPEPRLPSRPE